VAADAGLTVGLVLLVFGLVLLLQRMPAVWAFGMGLLRFSIPLALIAIGVLLLASRGRR
jgi:hypothetical protein